MPSASALFAAPLPVSTGAPEAASGAVTDETAGLFSSKLGDVLQAVGKTEATPVEPAHRAATLLSLVVVMAEEQDAAQTADPVVETATAQPGPVVAEASGGTPAPVLPEASVEPASDIEAALAAPPIAPVAPAPIAPPPVVLQPGDTAEISVDQATVSAEPAASLVSFPSISNKEEAAATGDVSGETAGTAAGPEDASTPMTTAPQSATQAAPAAPVQSTIAHVALKAEPETAPTAAMETVSVTKTPSSDKPETSSDVAAALKAAASIEHGATMKPTPDLASSSSSPPPLEAKVAEQPTVTGAKVAQEAKPQLPATPPVQSLAPDLGAKPDIDPTRLDVKVTVRPAITPAPAVAPASPAAPIVASVLTAADALEAIAAIETAAVPAEEQTAQTSVNAATPATAEAASRDSLAKAGSTSPQPTPQPAPQRRPAAESSPTPASAEALPAGSLSNADTAAASALAAPAAPSSPSSSAQTAAPAAAASAEAAVPSAPPAPSDAATPIEGHKTAHAAETLAGSGPAPSASALSHATIETTAHLAAQMARKLEGRSTRFDMVLTPEDLGRVDVSLEIGSDGQLAARLAFDNPAAAAELRGRADELRRQLQDAGFQLSNDSLDFTQRDSSSGGGFERQHQQRQALFTGAARLTAETDLPVSPPPGAWTNHSQTRDRVDVRV